jgi:hypothetical protein
VNVRRRCVSKLRRPSAFALAVIALQLLSASSASATAQAPDVLEYGGKTYYLQSNPLSPYLAVHRNALPKAAVVSSGLWRGYIATWSLGKDHLFLKDVRIPTSKYMEPDAPPEKQFRSAMENLFHAGGPQVATWFTGHLIVPTGELVHYVHMGYGSTYSSYLIATIVAGSVRKIKALDQAEFEAFRREQFRAFKNTSDYARAKAEARRGEDPMSDAMVDDFLFSFEADEFLSRIFEPGSK